MDGTGTTAIRIELPADAFEQLVAVAGDRDPADVAASIVAAVLADDAAMHRAPRPWTPADDRTIRTGRAMKLPASEIAKMLGRPKDEVAARMKEIRL